MFLKFGETAIIERNTLKRDMAEESNNWLSTYFNINFFSIQPDIHFIFL